jgi:hypothetical protein
MHGDPAARGEYRADVCSGVSVLMEAVLAKPTNSIAVTIGIIGIFYFILRLSELLAVNHAFDHAAATQSTEMGRALLTAVSRGVESNRIVSVLGSAILGTVQIIGIAIVIEFLDQIRWNTRRD